MNMQSKILAQIDLASCHHWSQEMPYRAIVAIDLSPQGTVRYQVAGDAKAPQNAYNALKLAITKFGGECFYCKKAAAVDPAPYETTIDHVEPTAIGGGNDLANLVIACKSCNQAKGMSRIDAFNPTATEEWLLALAKQIETRFERLKATQPPSQPQPSPGAAAGP